VTTFLRRNPLIAGLAVLCAILAAVVVIELAVQGEETGPAAARKAAPAEAKLVPALVAAAPDTAYPETASRPLWIPTRRPAPPAVAPSQQAFQRGQFVLQGVTIAGDTRIAMLKEKSSGRVHRVELGRDVNGVNLAAVEPESVTLAQGGEREVLDLRVQRPPSAPGTPGAAVAQPPHPAASHGGAAAAAIATGRPQIGVPMTPPQAPQPVPTNRHAPAPSSGPFQAPQATSGAFPANPAPAAVPQQSSAPMTPEELLARRRARRNQPTE
jgi:hypothetical protein